MIIDTIVEALIIGILIIIGLAVLESQSTHICDIHLFCGKV